ncbi:MAG: phage portal protein [Rickettsiales bacterium]
MAKFWRRAFRTTVQSQNVASETKSSTQSILHLLGEAESLRGGYGEYAREGYCRNVVAHRAVQLVAQSVAGTPRYVAEPREKRKENSRYAALISRPSPGKTEHGLFFEIAASLLIGGNAYICVARAAGMPKELHMLRQDRMEVVPGKGGMPSAYVYRVDGVERRFPVRPVTGESDVIHLKRFHPLSDWYGLASAEAAADAVDQHNKAAAWNRSLLQNGARPSGALVVGGDGYLPEEQYRRLKVELEDKHAGASNAGRPIILEGGLDWKEMSISPKDMEYIAAKDSAARDVALAFGVPPQLLGIPGDNTYSNMAEARLALWEQTVVPLAQEIVCAFNNALSRDFDGERMAIDYDGITALSPRRDALWKRVSEAAFLTDEEKRRMVGVE